MGCDIHVALEWQEQKDAPWVLVNWVTEGLARDRNYERFAALAGVRGPGPAARGLPPDVSPGTKYWSDGYNGDGHSHSWLPLGEFMKVMQTADLRGTRHSVLGMSAYECFRVDIGVEDAHLYRVVFWFDN